MGDIDGRLKNLVLDSHGQYLAMCQARLLVADALADD